MAGDYIPECTRRVFLKYYTPSGENQMYFWSKADREAYLGAMNGTLSTYLGILGKEIRKNENLRVNIQRFIP